MVLALYNPKNFKGLCVSAIRIALLILLLMTSTGCVSVDDIKAPDVTCFPEPGSQIFGNPNLQSRSNLNTGKSAYGKSAWGTTSNYKSTWALMAAVRKIPVRPVSAARTSSKRKWRYIIIHHSAGTSGNARSIGLYHLRVRRWSRGLGYHFVIGNGRKCPNGRIETGPRWRKQQTGAHAGVNKYNRHGIGICLVGSLDKTRPSAKQLAALRDLVRYLCRRYNISVSNVKGHYHIKRTQCPGKYFPMEEFRKELKRVM